MGVLGKMMGGKAQGVLRIRYSVVCMKTVGDSARVFCSDNFPLF